MGFTGRACIHPDQVMAVNAVFTPGEAEIAEARRVIAALEEARGAAALLDGKLIERPVILAARQVLERAGVL
jgi:citrate lyase subunit beta/citryl-CoA lyase/(S)-citramalyl-CoA lyase